MQYVVLYVILFFTAAAVAAAAIAASLRFYFFYSNKECVASECAHGVHERRTTYVDLCVFE